MTTILRTPKGWPSILLARAAAKDPTDLDAAVKAGAFGGLRKAVHDLGPTGVIATLAASRLRGRGGGGVSPPPKGGGGGPTPLPPRPPRGPRHRGAPPPPAPPHTPGGRPPPPRP